MNDIVNTGDAAEVTAAGERSERIPVKVKIAYGGSEFASSTIVHVIGIYFLIFLTDVVGISPAIAGFVMSVTLLWDAVTDPVMGIITDRTRSRWGRRRPYIIAVAVPYALIFWGLFSVPDLVGWKLVAYYVFFGLLMHTALTINDISYTALAPEMTKDYDERTSLVTYRTIWSSLSIILAGTVPLLIVKQFSDPKVGWSAFAGIAGFICIFPILLTWRGTRGWERYPEEVEPLDFRDIGKAVFGNRTFRYMIGAYLFCFIGAAAHGSMAMYFLSYWMNFTENQIALFYFVLSVALLFFVPLISYTARRLSKRQALMIYLAVWAGIFGIGIMWVQPDQVILMYVLASISSLGTVAIYQLCWAMIADVTEVDELKSGVRREGLYYSVFLFVSKVAGAAALLITGQILSFIGYVPNGAQTSSVLMGIRIMYGPVLAALLIIGLIMTYFMPMTRERHKALLNAIEAKKAGRPWDEESIRHL